MQMSVSLKGESIPHVVTGSSIKERPVSLDRGKRVLQLWSLKGLRCSSFGDLSESSHIPSLQFSGCHFFPQLIFKFSIRAMSLLINLYFISSSCKNQHLGLNFSSNCLIKRIRCTCSIIIECCGPESVTCATILKTCAYSFIP